MDTLQRPRRPICSLFNRSVGEEPRESREEIILREVDALKSIQGTHLGEGERIGRLIRGLDNDDKRRKDKNGKTENERWERHRNKYIFRALKLKKNANHLTNTRIDKKKKTVRKLRGIEEIAHSVRCGYPRNSLNF